jgi:hypothetical protein
MSEVTTAPVLEVARAFFEACETGKGWEVCQQFCTPDATFRHKAEPLADVIPWSSTRIGWRAS